MRIHLLDSNSIVTLTLKRFLAGLGHEVVAAGTAPELLDNLARSIEPVDLVILDDTRRGNGNGLGLVGEAHSRYPDIAFVIMKGNDMLFPVKEAIACGVYACLRKPVRLSELELAVARISERRAGSGPRSGANRSGTSGDIA